MYKRQEHNQISKPWCETKALVEKLILAEWNMRWQDDPQYVHTKFFYPQISIKKAHSLLDFSRAYVQLLTRAITGHNFLSKHQNRIGQPTAERYIPGQRTRRYPRLENWKAEEIHINHYSIRHANRERPLQRLAHNTHPPQLLIISRLRLKTQAPTHAYPVGPSQDGHTLGRQGH